jgi:hypothetical protein
VRLLLMAAGAQQLDLLKKQFALFAIIWFSGLDHGE